MSTKKKGELIDLYDHFRDKRAESLSRHVIEGVRVSNKEWCAKKRQERDERKAQ